MARIHNFSAGPAVLPLPVLEAARGDLLEHGDTGVGILECSHRSTPYGEVVEEARERLTRLLGLAEDQEVLFLHGGASSQFFMVPMNLLRGGRAAYLDTGRWSGKALAEAERFGEVRALWSSSDTGYDRVPRPGQWGELPPECVYLHYTSNNTVAGTQFDHVPELPEGCALVCDASSDILSRPLDGSRYDILYAGAQKNLGPAGVTVVVFRRSLLERCDPELPTMLRYSTHVEKGSMFNTPSTFGIYVVGEVLAWIEERGGLEAVGAANEAQAAAVYQVIDGSEFWRGLVAEDSRSRMNITFTTGDAELDTRFWKQAAVAGLSGLKGHRSVGGLRASLYNAQTDAAVEALVGFMAEFERTHG